MKKRRRDACAIESCYCFNSHDVGKWCTRCNHWQDGRIGRAIKKFLFDTLAKLGGKGGR